MLVLQTRCLESALDETSTVTLKILLSSVPIPINHTEKTVRKWSSVKEVGLQILQTEKIYNLCTRRWFLTASVQAYYNRRRRRRRRRRCSNRVAKLEWSSLILVLASRNVWHKRTTQTFCMDFFAIFFHSSIDHSSDTKNIRMIVSFWVWQVSRRLHVSSNITNSEWVVMAAEISVIPIHSCWKQLVILTSGTGYHSLILNSSTHETS
jgi:hypothetical protein